jgi:uncharacterized membrane protein
VTPGRFRALVSAVLIVGVVASAALIAVGFAGSLVVGWHGSLLGRGTSAASASDFGGIVDGLAALRPVAIAQAGIVVLIATPVVRVATSVAAFALEGDRLYTAITLGVLAILLGSLFLIR